MKSSLGPDTLRLYAVCVPCPRASASNIPSKTALARPQRLSFQRLSFQPGLKEQSLKRQSLGHWNLWHAHDLGQTALLNSGSAGSLPCEPRHSREASHHLLDGSDLGGSRNLCEQWRRHRNPGGTRLRLRTCCVWHSCRFSQNQECVRYTERM